jgi:hypothetical protein
MVKASAAISQLLHRYSLHVTVITVCQPGALLSTIPSVENVKLTKTQREGWTAEITYGDGIRSLIAAVVARAELIELTQQRAPLF